MSDALDGLDPDACFAAHRSRDPRFDGRFFVAVTSTRIYCRTICPARSARRENLRYYACAAAAEEAGFRPCRRCRPETAPGSPAWLGASATVGRALRLIDEGLLDAQDVEGLAARVGLGARHLRRLFDRHVGASPLQVARTRRVHFARRLVDETGLPMTEVALAAGFSSLRQFNDAMRATFGRPPSVLRRARARPPRDGALTLRLPYRAPLDWPGLLAYFAGRALPGVEAVMDGVYRRTLRTPSGTPGWLEVRDAGDGRHLSLGLHGRLSSACLTIAERVRGLFDLDADPASIAAHLGRDALLATRIASRPGLRVPGAWDGFELALRAVLGQQISVLAARTLAGRLVRACGTALPVELQAELEPYGLTHLAPSAAAVAAADLSGLGVTGARQATLHALARAVASGALTLSPSADSTATLASLRTLPGIGPWTAAYIALRALRDPDAWPAEDLGLRRACALDGVMPSVRALRERAEAWRPWRGYAALALWLDDPIPPAATTRTAAPAGARRRP
jgi:AraC family transcriptional regulator of adaptative response / DNA-3-methyladenine glycosylase II